MIKSVKTGQTVYIVLYPKLHMDGDDTAVTIKQMPVVSDKKRPELREPGIIMDAFPRNWLNIKLKRYPKGVAPVMFRTRGQATRWAKLNGKVIHE